MNGLAFENLHRFEHEKVIEKKYVGITDTLDDASVKPRVETLQRRSVESYFNASARALDAVSFV